MLTHLTSNQSVVLHFAVESKIPNKDFLEFIRTFLGSYFVRLGDIMLPEGGVAIKEECFGEYVSVTGTMSSFSGLPSLEPVVFISRLSCGVALDCLYVIRSTIFVNSFFMSV